MKFLPTAEQIGDAITTHVDTLDADYASELGKLVPAEPLVRLYNVTMMAVNAGKPASIQWRMMLILALRLGWIMREQAGAVPDVAGVFQGIDEGEIEAMFREIRASGGTA